MDITIETRHERERGCGFRKSGKDGVGIYLVGEGIFEPCERLPFPLTACPTCGGGIRFGRGWTWISPIFLFAPDIPPLCDMRGGHHSHETCLMCTPIAEKAGMLWVGEKFYDVGTFTREAKVMGISKRIAAIPHGFELGKTVVYLAHKKGTTTDPPIPAVFSAFRPSRLELVVDTDKPEELPERAIKLKEKYGDQCSVIKVEPVPEQQELPQEAE